MCPFLSVISEIACGDGEVYGGPAPENIGVDLPSTATGKRLGGLYLAPGLRDRGIVERGPPLQTHRSVHQVRQRTDALPLVRMWWQLHFGNLNYLEVYSYLI